MIDFFKSPLPSLRSHSRSPVYVPMWAQRSRSILILFYFLEIPACRACWDWESISWARWQSDHHSWLAAIVNALRWSSRAILRGNRVPLINEEQCQKRYSLIHNHHPPSAIASNEYPIRKHVQRAEWAYNRIARPHYATRELWWTPRWRLAHY